MPPLDSVACLVTCLWISVQIGSFAQSVCFLVHSLTFGIFGRGNGPASRPDIRVGTVGPSSLQARLMFSRYLQLAPCLGSGRVGKISLGHRD